MSKLWQCHDKYGGHKHFMLRQTIEGIASNAGGER